MSDRTGAASAPRRARPPRRVVAVLGGTGLLGAAVARRCLAAGDTVTVLARRRPEPGAGLAGCRVVTGDAADPDALERALLGATHVVDALGAPHPAAEASDAERAVELVILHGLLDALRLRPGTALTLLSSGGTVYGDPDVLPVPETAPCRPVSRYGATKLAAERAVLLRAADDGLAARVLRIGNAYGHGQRHDTGQGLVAAMLHAAATGAPLRVFGDGSSRRDYVDARDVADAVVGLLDLGGPRVVNVGTGVGHRVREVRAVVEQVTGRSIEVRFEPSRPTDVRDVVLDCARLAGLVAWRPRALREGVADAWRTATTAPVRAPLGAS